MDLPHFSTFAFSEQSFVQLEEIEISSKIMIVDWWDVPELVLFGMNGVEFKSTINQLISK